MIERLLQESIDRGVISVADLKTKIEAGECDTWPVFREYVRLEAQAIGSRRR
jgi:hypothetical protein